MFSKEQIMEAFSKVKSGEDFPRLARDLSSIGVSRYDNFVEDGKTKYHSADDQSLEGDAKYPSMPVADNASIEDLQHALKIHQAGETDYPTFCSQAADAGVNMWTTDMDAMTVSYYDKIGNLMLTEMIASI